MIRINMLVAVAFVYFAGCSLLPGQKKDDGGDSDTNSPDETIDDDGSLESEPTVGALAIGGIPAEEELAELAAMDLDEANASAHKINSAQGSLALDLTNSSSGASLTQDDDSCNESFFCFAKAFSDIYDMVTGSAQCNFDLLLGGELNVKQVAEHPIFYADGWGTLTLGENGLAPCPAQENVSNFVSRIKDNSQNDSDEFFFPMRLVMFKKPDGNVHWRMLFFPADFIGKLAKRIPPFQNLVDKELDFHGFYGAHDITKDVGTGAGKVVIDFDELGRMFALLDSAFEDDNSEPEEDDGGMPQGKIDIEYDLNADPQSLTTTFKNGFTFGDDDESPFQSDTPTKILRSGDENYLHFLSSDSFVKNDEGEEDQTDPFHMVYLCDTDGDFTYIKDIPKDKYLPTASTTHMQMIWKSLKEGQVQPDKYAARVTQTKGGPFIYGPTMFEGASNGNKALDFIRIRTPLCSSLQSALDDQGFAVVSHVPIGQDGFINAITAENQNQGPQWLSSKEALEQFPAFAKFRFIDPANSKDTPLGASGSSDAKNHVIPTAGHCTLPSGVCTSFSDLSYNSLTAMHTHCTAPLYDPNFQGDQGPTGLNGSWDYKTPCADNAIRTCSATNFPYGEDGEYTIEAATSHYYTIDQLSTNDVCADAGGTIEPPIAASCSNVAGGQVCVSITQLQHYTIFGADASTNGSCMDPSSWNGTWNATTDVCLDTGLSGTCAMEGGSIAKVNTGSGLGQSWCEDDLGGTWTPQ